MRQVLFIMDFSPKLKFIRKLSVSKAFISGIAE